MDALQGKVLEALNGARAGAGLPGLVLDSSCARLLNEHCERMIAAAGSGADASSATPQTLASLCRAGILDVRHLIAASGAVSGALGDEGAEGKEDDSAAGAAAAAGVLFDTLASQEALQAMVTSPAAAEPLTHVAVGFASDGSGSGSRAAVCVALLDRTASVIGAGDTGAQLLRTPGASTAAAVGVYRDELSEAGAGVVTLQLRPDADASAAARPALGARIVLLKGGAASALAVAGDAQALPAVPATVQDEEARLSLDQVAACWQRIRVPPLEDGDASTGGATAGAAASGFAEAFDGSGAAFVWPWQVNCHGDDATADVEVPLAVPLLEAAAASAGGAGGAGADEPLATVLVQLVGDASGGPGAANVDEADESFPVARLRPRRPLTAGAGDAAGAGAGEGESVSSAVVAVHIYASRPPSHPPKGASSAAGSAVALDEAPTAAGAGVGSAVRSRRSSAGAGAGGGSSGSAAGRPLPDGFAPPAERPAVAAEAHAVAPLQAVALSAVPGGSSSSSSAAATLKPQHVGCDGSRAPLATLLPQSLLLGFSDAAAAAGGAGDASSAPISRLMLVSGSSEADALASAPDGFELLPGNLADAVKQSLAAASSGDSGAAGGAGAGSVGSNGSVVTVHPAAVFIAVQRVGAPGSLGDASPLVDAGLIVVAGVTAASASAIAGAGAGAGAGGDSGSSDASAAGSGLLLPSIAAPAGYSLQMKDVVLTREADTASASSTAAAAGEGKEDEAEGKEGDAPSASSSAPAAARAGVRIVLLSTADAGAVEAAVRASTGTGSAPLAVPVSDHPAAAAAVGDSFSSADTAAAGGAGGSRTGSAGRAAGRPHMQIEADGVVGSAGEDATSAVPPPPPPAPLVAGSRAGSRPTSGGPPRPPGHLALKLLGEKAGAGGAAGGAGAGDDEGDELAALGGGPARGAGGAGGAAAGGGKGTSAAAAGGAGAGRGGGGGAREDKHRQQLVELLAAALAQQQQLAAANATLHRQLTTYFSLRQGEGEGAAGAPGAAAAAAAAVAAATGGGGPGSKSAAAAAFAAADKERRYREQLDGASADRERLAAVTAQGERDATELQLRVEEREAKAEQLSAAFGDFKHQIAAAAVNSHTGRRIPADELERAEALEREKDGDVAKVQLRHVHLAAQVAKLESSLRKREQVADGLALMDFEQLKIENATLTEKIEDRNEELAKLKKKAAVAVQILTHVREKLHFVQAEAGRLGSELAALEAEVSEQRALLALAKKERELARAEAERAAHAQGFAHADRLAIDFERRKRDIVACRDALDATHARLARLHEVAAERTALLAAAMGTHGGGVAVGRGGFSGLGTAGSTASSLGGFAGGGASAGSRAFAASSAGTHGTAATGGAGSGSSRRPPVPVPTGHAPAASVRSGAAGSAATLSGGIRAGLSAGVASSGGSVKR